MGIQDFHEPVQHAINRIHLTKSRGTDQSRAHWDSHSINVEPDLRSSVPKVLGDFGLPSIRSLDWPQTASTLSATLTYPAEKKQQGFSPRTCRKECRSLTIFRHRKCLKFVEAVTSILAWTTSQNPAMSLQLRRPNGLYIAIFQGYTTKAGADLYGWA